jgi:RNA polymerase sigma factor (sigma-70 family)
MSLQPERHWSLSREAFDLLLRRLKGEPEAAAHEYEAVRRRLRSYFAIRGLQEAEALADETLDRIARRLEEGEVVEHFASYLYAVAENVYREALRQQARQQAAAFEIRRSLLAADTAPNQERFDCLKRCLRKLDAESRALILGYYRGEGASHLEGRKLLAVRLGLSYANLKTRAHRIRGLLEQCLRRCLEAGEGREQ